MSRRLTVIVALACISIPWVCFAQQVTKQVAKDMVIPGATLNDGFMGPMTCNAEGQLYRRPEGRGGSVMRVDKDGSTLLFTLPEPEQRIGVIAPAGTGLAVLNSHYSPDTGITYEMYRFDGQGKLVAQHSLSLDFRPNVMAVNSSGKVIVVGYRPINGTDEMGREYVGAVLDEDDQLQISFDIPLTDSGTKWMPFRTSRMASSDGVTHLILQSGAAPNFALGNIAESGKVEVIPLDTVRGASIHDWFFGGGVAADTYQFPDETPPPISHWDTYDLSAGKRVKTTAFRPAGFAVACYFGDEVSMLAHSAHVEKSRGLPPDALRLVTVKLE